MGKYAKLDLVKKRVDELQPHPINPRSHPDAQIELVKDWLTKLSYYKNIVVQTGTNYVLAGHSVLEALKQSDYEFVDVNEEDLPEEMALALMAWDNKSGELSFWDQVNLIALEAELKEMDVEMAEMGFGDGEIDSMVSNAVTQDDPPAVSEEEPVTQTGDLWYLGDHRVLCADSTVKENVERVMGGMAHVALFTDPPYGIGVDTSWLSALHIQRGKPACVNDDKLQGDDGSLDCSFLWEYDRRMIWGFPYIFDPEATGWIVWDKQPGIEKRGIVSPVEMASTTMRKGFDIVRCMWGGYYKESGETRENHPTQKPVKVFATFIEGFTDPSDTIIDPFLGSGTTLMAADQLDRKCYGIEISPRYVDVCVKRYINHVGTDEDVYVERDGDRLSWEEAQMPQRQKVIVR